MAAYLVAVLVAVGQANPWNLTLVDAALDHPFVGLTVMMAVGALVLAQPHRSSRMLTVFAWFSVGLGTVAIGAAVGVITNWLLMGSAGSIAITAGTLTTFGLLAAANWRRRFGSPGRLAYAPVLLVLLVSVVGSAFDLAAGPWYSHYETAGADGLRVDWVTTGPPSNCESHLSWLKSGSGVSEHRIVVDSGYCGNRVGISEGGVITVRCERQLTVDRRTLKVLTDTPLARGECH